MEVDRGFFVLDDATIVEVEGYDECIRRSRKTVLGTGEPTPDYLSSTVYWTRPGAEDRATEITGAAEPVNGVDQ